MVGAGHRHAACLHLGLEPFDGTAQLETPCRTWQMNVALDLCAEFARGDSDLVLALQIDPKANRRAELTRET